MSRNPSDTHLETKLIHAGECGPQYGRAVILPIFQSSTYEYSGQKEYGDVRYLRLNNTPNHEVVSKKIAEIEGAECGMITASGMAAITTALLAAIPEGGEVLAQEDLYGGTDAFFRDTFPKLGRRVKYFALSDLNSLSRLHTEKTAAIYVESVSNPLMRVPDFQAVVNFARTHRLLSLIDNTFSSPVNFNPIEVGFDVVLHSASKYLNGHSDIVAGCILGTKSFLTEATALLNILGGSMDPHAAFLLHRGMKTLSLRVRYQNDSALALARALESHPKVKRVLYTGLESHADFALAKKYFRGHGGVLSFEYDASATECDAYLKRLKYAVSAPSLGGPETLVTRPVTTSHSAVPAPERLRLGLHDNLIRVSVGLEHTNDLIDDFIGAL